MYDETKLSNIGFRIRFFVWKKHQPKRAGPADRHQPDPSQQHRVRTGADRPEAAAAAG